MIDVVGGVDDDVCYDGVRVHVSVSGGVVHVEVVGIVVGCCADCGCVVGIADVDVDVGIGAGVCMVAIVVGGCSGAVVACFRRCC